jgi:hypothetical protein
MGTAKGSIATRVTRLGEFEPLGRLFTIAVFSIAKMAHIFVQLFSQFCINFDKKGFGATS